MVILLAFLAIAVFLAGIAGGVYWYYRRILREAKNYERGLKMVPLLIHLPPASDDTEVGSRDVRDVAEETISHAQVLYNIISSTATKGFKSKFYGQRHMAFEIIASQGVINYYCAVPVALVDIVKQAVVAAYPAARLEETTEHNIFSKVGKLTGTIGGELTLKKEYAYPIATYQETKRDAMRTILNALSTITEEDGVGIQILLRPAAEQWSKNASAVASKKRKGKGKSNKLGFTVREILEAPFKPPEAKESKPEDKQLSSLEQATVDAIEEKTRHPGYETLVRVIASSSTAARSQAILKNVAASFSMFDASGRNGFKFSLAKNMEEFVTAFIFRFFPPEINQNVLNSVELATIFHLPDQRNTPTSQLQRQSIKQVDGPHNVPRTGLLLGYNVFRGVKKEIRIDTIDRRRHIYIIGQTGTGKSNLLENLALQDMLDGKGFAFIDPHGDVVESLLSMVPKERVEDVIYFSPGEMDYPMGLNLFEFETSEQRDFLVQEALNMLQKLYDPGHTGIMGPRYEHLFRNVALTVMSDPNGGTFIDLPKVFTDKEFSKEKLKHVTDKTVLDFWNKEMAQTSDYHKSEVMGWFVSKFGAFLSNEMMRNIIGQTKSSFNLRDVMDKKKILLVNLAKGRTGDINHKLLGMIFVMKFQVAAMSRVDIPEDQREDFTLYVDEFQNFATDSFAEILAEARKFRLSLVVANQFMSQLTEQIREAVIGNVGTIMSLRVGTTDADLMTKKFAPVFDAQDLVHLPNFEAIAQVMVNNVPSAPFSMSLIPRLGKPNQELGQALKRLSGAKYGKPRAEVEKEIFDRLSIKEPEKKQPAFGFDGAPPSGGVRGGGAQPAPAPGGGSSFLDEWLAKRRAQQGQTGRTTGGQLPPQGVRSAAPNGMQTNLPPSYSQRAANMPQAPQIGDGQRQPLSPPPANASSTSSPFGQSRPYQPVDAQQSPVTHPSTKLPSSIDGRQLGANVKFKETNGEPPKVDEKKIREDLKSMSWMNNKQSSDFKVLDPRLQAHNTTDVDEVDIAGKVQRELQERAQKEGMVEAPQQNQPVNTDTEGVFQIRRDGDDTPVEEIYIDNRGRLLKSRDLTKSKSPAQQQPSSDQSE